MGKQTKPLSSRMELAAFSERLLDYSNSIKSRQNKLGEVGTLFSPGLGILPFEFENVVNCIVSIGECSREFHALIEESVSLPLVVVPLRLPLLIALQHVNVHVAELERLLDELNEIIWTSIHPLTQKRTAIQRELEKLRRACKEILDQVDILQLDLLFEKDREQFPKYLYSIR